jgi:hypothetical protein
MAGWKSRKYHYQIRSLCIFNFYVLLHLFAHRVTYIFKNRIMKHMENFLLLYVLHQGGLYFPFRK